MPRNGQTAGDRGTILAQIRNKVLAALATMKVVTFVVHGRLLNDLDCQTSRRDMQILDEDVVLKRRPTLDVR